MYLHHSYFHKTIFFKKGQFSFTGGKYKSALLYLCWEYCNDYNNTDTYQTVLIKTTKIWFLTVFMEDGNANKFFLYFSFQNSLQRQSYNIQRQVDPNISLTQPIRCMLCKYVVFSV